jgi:hypothetical protein
LSSGEVDGFELMVSVDEARNTVDCDDASTLAESLSLVFDDNTDPDGVAVVP